MEFWLGSVKAGINIETDILEILPTNKHKQRDTHKDKAAVLNSFNVDMVGGAGFGTLFSLPYKKMALCLYTC